MIKLKIIIAAIVATGIAGFASGCWVTYKYFRVAALEAANKTLVKEGNRIREALDISEKLDDEDAVIELSNKEIQDALRKKVDRSKPDDPVCVSADSMLELRRLR